MKVGITYHEKFGQYDLGADHPFRGDRFINVMQLFTEQGLLDLPNVMVLTPESVAKRDLLRVHDEAYLDLVFRLAESSQPYDIETPVSPQILEAARLVVGGAVEAGKAVYEERVNRAVALGCGFHHAGRDYGGGFCLFNDIAVLVELLRDEYGLTRFLVLDYDVHFGNGTSDIYYSDPGVLFVSLHQDPRTIYPGTGFVEQIGEGAGKGYNVNVPLPPGTGDETFLQVVSEVFAPLAEEFGPEIILGNGGSDPHFGDMLGSLGLTVNGFFKLSRSVVNVAEKVCEGRVVLMPGSGYNPVVLPACWFALAAGVIGLDKIGVDDPYPPPVEPEWCRRRVRETLTELKRILKKYWHCFR